MENKSCVLVVHRRLFEKDRSRFFIGKVEGYEGGIARITGYTWVQDSFHGTMLKKEGLRTKIFSITSGTLIVYVLPESTKIESVQIDYDRDNRILVSDEDTLLIDLSEGLHSEARVNK